MRRPSIAALAALIVGAGLAVAVHDTSGREALPLPGRLSATGLFEPGTSTPRPGNLPFSPQYPLWSDGAAKRRWIYLPPGTAIDAADPDAWDFPPGTKLWKEFGHAQAVETRYLERLADGTWRFATYVWDEAGRDALLAPDEGTVVELARAPGGRYVVPSRQDCLACHDGPRVPVLGFSGLQLSPDRDALAPHAEAPQRAHADVATLAATGRVRNLPGAWLVTPPRIAGDSADERAALGYLHANCGHCHNPHALGALDLPLAQEAAAPDASAARTREALIARASRFRPQGVAAHRVAADGSGMSVLTLRMRASDPLVRMPPLGVQITDDEGLALVERWIRQDLRRPRGESP